MPESLVGAFEFVAELECLCVVFSAYCCCFCDAEGVEEEYFVYAFLLCVVEYGGVDLPAWSVCEAVCDAAVDEDTGECWRECVFPLELEVHDLFLEVFFCPWCGLSFCLSEFDVVFCGFADDVFAVVEFEVVEEGAFTCSRPARENVCFHYNNHK